MPFYIRYRIYDNEDKKWIKDNIFLTPNGDLYKKEKSFFRKYNLSYLGNKQRYIIHNAIELYDKNYKSIFEGDYLKAQVDENKVVIGVVVYSNELSSYILLCHDTDEYFTLGSYISEYIEIIGNVFDGYSDEKYKGQQTL